MKPTQPFKLSETDVLAILTALPIVENMATDAPGQQMLNRSFTTTAREKLLSGRKDFSANELRVIAVSVGYAVLFLSGHMPEVGSLLPDSEALRKYALSYIRLNSYFQSQL